MNSTIDDAYNDVPLSLLSPVFIPSLFLLFFLGLVSTSRTLRVLLFIHILASTIYAWLYTTCGSDDGAVWALIAQIVLMASDAFLISDVHKLKRVGQEEDTDQLGIRERAKWALHFICNLRHIGWTHEPRHVLPPHPTETKWQFVRWGLLKCLWYYALCDIAETIIQYLPLHKWRETSTMAIFWRVMHTSLYAFTGCLGLYFIYTAIATVAVSLAVTEPSEWPSFVGKWSEAYTVRRFWGRTWHQGLRRVLSAHGDFVAYKLLGLDRDTSVGVNVQRYVAFGTSGLLHAISDYGMFRSNFWDLSRSMSFFLLQATVIMLEQEVGTLWRIKPGRWTRRLGYVWTFFWFVLTFPPWSDPQIRFYPAHWSLGLWKTGSITNYLFVGKWSFE